MVARLNSVEDSYRRRSRAELGRLEQWILATRTSRTDRVEFLRREIAADRYDLDSRMDGVLAELIADFRARAWL